MSKKKAILNQDDMMRMLDACYQKVREGIVSVSPSVEVMAHDYLDKSPTPAAAAKKMISAQIAKCTTSGFITGFGGFITLPIAIPANIGSVLYVQMRMIACTAYMAGYDLNCDQVQTFVYACLAGVTVNTYLKKAGIKVGEKMALKMINKIPKSVLNRINSKVGFRFITKMGETGIINMGKLVPGLGAVINGGFDLIETKIIADRAYKWFFEGDFSGNEEDPESITEIVDEPEAIEIEDI